MTQATTGSNGSGAKGTATSPTVVESFAPVSGEKLGEAPVFSAVQVHEVVQRARHAQKAWAMLSVEERGERMLQYRNALVDRGEEIVALLSAEAGKPRHEALLHELMVVADWITYWAKEAPAVLAPEERPLHMLKTRRAIVSYVPRGVIGIISPWNFPVNLMLRDVIQALMAGNAAVVKPSEVTPLISLKCKEVWDDAGMPEDLFGMVTGFGPTGAALIDSGIDLCVFTGSVRTGKRVAAACGERLIPCVMELGGKAPLIACSDCDVERTARSIVGGGFANSGQICVSVERVYAHRDVHDKLLNRVVELTNELRLGDPVSDWCDIGGVTFEAQIGAAEAHIEDAVSKGAKVRAGGRRVQGPKMQFEPTVIAGCTHDCTVMTEETFGPVVGFMEVSSEEEALQLANDSHLGLNAYVFTEDPVRGRRLAERIEAGSVLVNEVLINGALPETPFGGIKESGFGRMNGVEGIRTMCTTKHINLDRIKLPPNNPLSFPYTETRYKWAFKSLRAMFTSGGILKRIGELF